MHTRTPRRARRRAGELCNIVCEMGDPERGDVTYIIDPTAPKVTGDADIPTRGGGP